MPFHNDLLENFSAYSPNPARSGFDLDQTGEVFSSPREKNAIGESTYGFCPAAAMAV
jgi:hypothetical protein